MPKPGEIRKWDPKEMENAITEVRAGNMGILLASKTFHVPFATLQRAARSERTISEILATPLGRKPVFNKSMEMELVKYLKEMESRFWGLTPHDVRSLAFQLARKNNIENSFSVIKECAGKDWLHAFIKRHKNEISVRRSTSTSFDRAKGFNRESVALFFSLLEREYEKYKFPPSRIWNVDETGIYIVQSKQPKILTTKGKRQIGAITSAERDSLITVVNCMNARGCFVPPYFIFPRKNLSPLLMKNAPPGADCSCHISGWIQIAIFTKWFDHFLRFVKPSKKEPTLLVLDGHYSHTRNIEVLDKARKNGVIIISLPPHSTHKLQPIDKTFMGPLKCYYNDEIRRFTRENGRKVTQYDIMELFSKAYIKVQTAQIAISGFMCTGIYPFDKNIFTTNDFISDQTGEQRDEVSLYSSCDNNLPSTSSVVAVTPWDISPPPKIQPSTSKRGEKTTATILTTSPYSSDENIWPDIPPNNETKCIFCHESLAEDQEARKWTQCLQCDLVWAHESCLPKKSPIFVCQSCA